MDRYHIFRLGLAAVFCAAFCIRPMLVCAQNNTKTQHYNDEYVFYQGVQGKPGVDFPVYSHIPRTGFTCRNLESGYYADLDTECQVFHICEDSKKISFLCPNGTIFQQSELICEWWFKVNCTNSPNLYEESAEQLREDNARRKSSRRVILQHGAVMRTEEQLSISASQNGRNVNLDKTPKQEILNQFNQEGKGEESRVRIQGGLGNKRVLIRVSSNGESQTVSRNHNRRKNSGHNRKVIVPENNSFKTEPANYNQYNEARSTTSSLPQTSNSNKQYQNSNLENNNQRNNNQFNKENNSQSRKQYYQNTEQQYSSSTELPSTVYNRFDSTKTSSFINDFPSTPTRTTNSETYYKQQTESTFRPRVTQRLKSTTNFKKTPLPTFQPPQNKVYEENKSSVYEKQTSTVPLTKNDIINKQIEETDSDETQITQETGSFYKNNFNRIEETYKTTTTHPNHRETYEELKEPRYYSTKITSAISSVTPQYLTTQPLNNGRPFIGSQVGTVKSTSTFAPFTTTELFNVGITGRELPPQISTLSPVTYTNSVPPTYYTAPLNLTVPPPNSLNIAKISLNPTVPPFEPTTKKVVDHATVYGRFVSTASSTTPLPSREILQTSNTYYTPKPFGKSYSTKDFGYNQNSISLGPTYLSTTSAPLNGFYVTKNIQHFDPPSTAKYNNEVHRPRPFQLQTNPEEATSTVPTYKVSSASPFTKPTSPTLFTTTSSSFENVDSMINALVEMASQDYSGETPRPGLVIPPSAGPQTLHTLAVYFANALDGIAKDNPNHEDLGADVQLTQSEVEKRRLTALLTQMTMNRYNELFEESTTSAPSEDLEGQHSKAPVKSSQGPKVRQLAKVFTQALSSYLDDPATFKRVLEEIRPTEPPNLDESDVGEDELLNFSDADSKSSYPPIFPTPPAPRPTWGYVYAPQQDLDVKNSLQSEQENLQSADSQSFVSQYNKLGRESSTVGPALPYDHWTSSPGAQKLWKSAFSFDPASINENFDVSTEPMLETTTEEVLDVVPLVGEEHHHEIKYEVRALPKLALNSSQVHGILIDFMNTTKTDDSNRLQRILRKLNTTEDEFLDKMREIETNPLTKRLILLLISECGTNASKELRAEAVPIHSLLSRAAEEKEVLETASSVGGFPRPVLPNSNVKELVDDGLDENDHDTRALQLLNSLYTIASKFGK